MMQASSRLGTTEIEPMVFSRLRTHGGDSQPASRPAAPNPASRQGSFLRGSLSNLPPQELLEYLAVLRRPGSLTVKNGEGLVANCEVTTDRLISASLGQLQDTEAILELLSWQEGTFELRPVGAPTAVGESARLAEIALQYARLSDELVRRTSRLPAADQPLVLKLGQALPEDPLEVGLGGIAAALQAWPGLTRAELEAQASCCRLKVRLALALLVEAGCL